VVVGQAWLVSACIAVVDPAGKFNTANPGFACITLSCFSLCVQVWRGEHYACSHSEYLQVKRQLMSETHAAAPGARDAEAGEGGSSGRSWQELSSEEQGRLLKERLKKYTQKVGPWVTCVWVCATCCQAGRLLCTCGAALAYIHAALPTCSLAEIDERSTSKSVEQKQRPRNS
jgi:hypothetical protein